MHNVWNAFSRPLHEARWHEIALGHLPPEARERVNAALDMAVRKCPGTSDVSRNIPT